MDAEWRSHWIDCAKVIRSLKVPILLMSATIPVSFEKDVWSKLGMDGTETYARVIRAPSTQRHNISHQIMTLPIVRPTGNPEPKIYRSLKIEQWSPIVKQFQHMLYENERGILFCLGIDNTKEWAQKLGIPFVIGSMTTKEKAESWNQWRDTPCGLIVVNKAGFYGMDQPNVRFALHLEKPRYAVDYSQASGRLGREPDQLPSLSAILVESKSKSPCPDDEETFSGAVAMKQIISGEKCAVTVLSKFLDGNDSSCSKPYGGTVAGVERVICGTCLPNPSQLTESDRKDMEWETTACFSELSLIWFNILALTPGLQSNLNTKMSSRNVAGFPIRILRRPPHQFPQLLTPTPL